jgi:hypothetical protein
MFSQSDERVMGGAHMGRPRQRMERNIKVDLKQNRVCRCGLLYYSSEKDSVAMNLQ